MREQNSLRQNGKHHNDYAKKFDAEMSGPKHINESIAVSIYVKFVTEISTFEF